MNATTTPHSHRTATDAAGHHAPRPVDPLCTVEILRGHHDASNGGLTGRPRRCPLYTEDQLGAMTVDQAANLPAHALVLIQHDRPTITSGRIRRYAHIQPIAEVPEGHRGWMFGGAYAVGNVRLHDLVGHHLPLPIHDRSEAAR